MQLLEQICCWGSGGYLQVRRALEIYLLRAGQRVFRRLGILHSLVSGLARQVQTVTAVERSAVIGPGRGIGGHQKSRFMQQWGV